jgi:WD40 repeat protein
MVLVGFKDGHSRVFEATTAKAISPMLDVPVGGPPAVFSPDGETLLIFAKKEAAVFNIRGGKRITTLPLPPGVVFENSAFFLRGHHDNYIVKLSFPELKITDSLRILDSVLSTSLSPDGKRIQIQQGRTGQERLLFFDAATLKPLE